MRRFSTLAVLLALLSLAASPAVAVITPMAYYRLGEDDPGAMAGNPGGATTFDQLGGTNLTLSSGAPIYSASTPHAGSTLSMDFAPGGNYTASSALINQVDNWGIEMSVYPTAIPASNRVVAYNGNSASSGFGLLARNGQWSILVGGLNFGDTGVPITVNQWNHLAAVRESGTARLYVNGTPQGNPVTTSPNAPTALANVGGNFDGLVDEVRFFTFAPGQFNPATDLLPFPPPPPPPPPLTPLAYYRTGESDAGASPGGAGAAATVDEVAGFDLNRSGSPAYTSNTPLLGTSLAMDFSAGGNYSRSGVVTPQVDNWGVEAWVYPFESNQPNSVLAYNGNGGNSGFGLLTRNGQWSTLIGGKTYGDTGVPVVADEWTHLAVIRMNGVMRLYVDGVPTGNSTTVVPNMPAGSVNFGGNFNGLIDEVRFFSVNPATFDPQQHLLLDLYVPEPGALALLFAGCAGIVVLLGRRRRSRAA